MPMPRRNPARSPEGLSSSYIPRGEGPFCQPSRLVSIAGQGSRAVGQALGPARAKASKPRDEKGSRRELAKGSKPAGARELKPDTRLSAEAATREGIGGARVPDTAHPAPSSLDEAVGGSAREAPATGARSIAPPESGDGFKTLAEAPNGTKVPLERINEAGYTRTGRSATQGCRR